MKKLAAAALILGTLSTGSVWAHEAGEFFIRAGTATVRPTEGSDNVLGSLGSFNVSNNTQLGLTFTGNDSNLLIVFYVQIMPDDFVMQLHR
ncbi:OmpW family outer membrane protein, partial [Klebsiella pneumoniae]|uniref:OmpW family outer membrane protein n=1 Tax=Klebsiella pneumoniae TaxID=573 RepID=UPI0023DB5F97